MNMRLGLEQVSEIQIKHGDSIRVRYNWVTGTDTPVPQLAGVRIFLMKPNPGLWELLMTADFGGLQVDVAGTRNGNHDALDECYRPILDRVNAKREAMGFSLVRI
jgi:hypothetical protein